MSRVEKDIVSLTKKNPLSLWVYQDLSDHRRFLTSDTRKKITSLGLNIVNGMQTLYTEPSGNQANTRIGVGAQGRLKKILWLQ